MRARCFVVALLVLLASREAYSEPAPSPTPSTTVVPAPTNSAGETKIKTTEPRWLCVPGTPVERCIALPPGRFLGEPTWSGIDTEFKRLQDAETRLTAENTSLRQSASGWQPGWKLLVGTLVVGFVGGVAAYRYAQN